MSGMKKALVGILTAGAVLLGLLLPSLVSGIQDKQAEKQEDAGIQPVNLSVSSGLTTCEKIMLFADENSTTLGVGVGQNQTVQSLTSNSWSLLELLFSYGATVLTRETVVQEQQSAVLISNGDQAYILWKVLFDDGDGNMLTLYLDDETGLPLSLEYYSADAAQNVNGWAYVAAETMLLMNGLALENLEGFEADSSPELTEGAATAETAAAAQSGTTAIIFSDPEQGGQYTISAAVSPGWFSINPLGAKSE